LEVNKIEEVVKNQSSEGNISCSEAFNIAKEYGCSPKEVGEACDRLKIKIVSCQLGCF